MCSDRIRAIPEHWPGRPQRVSVPSVTYKRVVDDSLLDCLSQFVRDSVGRLAPIGLKDVVVGVSGGLDSATMAALCRHSLGRERVEAAVVDLGLESHAAQTREAVEVVRKLDLDFQVIDAAKLLTAATETLTGHGPYSQINVVTRTIHSTIFQLADRQSASVASTLNRSEALLGRHMEYFYGHFAPLAGLYKTEVADVGRRLGVPASVLEREPGCYEAWFDREVLGAGYEIIDPILHLLVDRGWTASRIGQEFSIDENWLSRIERRVREHRWRMNTQVLDLPPVTGT